MDRPIPIGQSVPLAIVREGARQFVTVEGVQVDVTGAEQVNLTLLEDGKVVVYCERGPGDVSVVTVERR